MRITTLSLIAALAVNSAYAGGDFGTTTVEPVVEIPAVEEPELEISANLAIASNYVWRGMTQSHNSPAVQGGLDLGYKGFYLGTWGSNVQFGDTNNNLEADFYAGYAGSIDGFGYDLGYIYYAYPNESDAFNFDEAYIGLSYDFNGFGVNGKYSFGLDTENDTTDYWEVGASAGLPMDMTLAASYGDYDEVGTNYIVSISKTFGKFDIALAYTDFEAEVGDAEEDHIVATLSTSF